MSQTISELLENKRSETRLSRRDLAIEEDDPNWKERHPIGPVHCRVRCLLCDSIIASDLMEFGWIENDSYWVTNLLPHFKLHT